MPSEKDKEILEKANEIEDSDPPGASDFMETLRRSEELSKKAETYAKKSNQTITSVTFTNQSD